MKAYHDPVIFDKQQLIYVRFDGLENPASFNVPIYFDNNDVLNNKHIKGIEVKSLPVLDVGSSTILTDLGFIGTVISQDLLNYFTITIVGKNNEKILEDYPLLAFNKLFTFGKLRSTNMIIDLSKSYIRNFGLSGITKTNVIPIQFYYSEKRTRI